MKNALSIIILLLLTACANNDSKIMPEKNITTRFPAVSGNFYPYDPEELGAMISGFLSASSSAASSTAGQVRAILVPHAGYMYSGQTAAYAYQAIAGRSYKRVFVLADAHSEAVSGIAVDDNDYWESPLGDIAVDRKATDELVALPGIAYDRKAHLHDHVLEVQMPWLQAVLEPGFTIVPLLFGASDNGAADNLLAWFKHNLRADDLLVISTDLSHYPPYEKAQTLDKQTLERIAALDWEALEAHLSLENREKEAVDTLACGPGALEVFTKLALADSWQAEILHYANSGDSPIGRKERVVGYGAVAFYSQADKTEDKTAQNMVINQDQKQALLAIARQSVESFAKGRLVPEFEVLDPLLKAPAGAFVTLRQKGELKGCIGQIVPTGKPLWEVVREMAIAAASEDPRFEPVSEKDLDRLEYEVSVLSVPRQIGNWQEIELGRHGVIVEKGGQKGVFLPQVADETGWSKEEFLRQLCSQKAGLSPDAYKNDPDLVFKVFTAQAFSST